MAVRSVEVEGTAFRITLSDGRIVPQDRLPGTILALGDGSGARRRIRIDAVVRDSKDPAREIVLYKLSEQDAESGEWHNLCLLDPDGRRHGFLLAGAFTAGGRYEPSRPGILLTCTGGAEGKCVRFGYKPWGFGPNNSSRAANSPRRTGRKKARQTGDAWSNLVEPTPA
ncbi:MAG: ADYC domain-containing protein [Beijerinckiaceae bacterium]